MFKGVTTRLRLAGCSNNNNKVAFSVKGRPTTNVCIKSRFYDLDLDPITFILDIVL